jgi:5-formyltetrahydrofolate cyclo-ligase
MSDTPTTGRRRLGYGGDPFDRMPATFLPRPFTIGIGFQSARLATIHAQSRDILPGLFLRQADMQLMREAP